MKRLFTVLMLVLLTASQVFALSDSEYLKMKKNNPGFARADKKLGQVWKELKNSMSKEDFEILLRNQRKWLSEGRDKNARAYMKEGYSRVEAYMLATNDRAKELPEIADNIKNSQPENDNEEFFDEDNEESEEDEKFVKTDKNGRKIFLTVEVTDKYSNYADVTFNFENSNISWTSNGWVHLVDDNVQIDLSDRNYPCEVTVNYIENGIRVTTTGDEVWDDILGEGNRLDGVYNIAH